MLQRKTILVTGAAGYIGTHTIVQLLQSDYGYDYGYAIVALDNFSNNALTLSEVRDRISSVCPDASVANAVTWYSVDIRNKSRLETIFSMHPGIECVIHFAGLKSVSDSISKPLDYYDNNVGGTLVLLQTMQRHNVKRIIFSSSATVYGNRASPLVETMDGLDPINPYGRTKLYIESVLFDVCRSDPTFQAVMLRYFNPIGAHPSGIIGEAPDPRVPPANLMPYILQVASGRRDALNVFGGDYPTRDGTAERDYIHVLDVADGHVAVLALQTPGAHIFNLGTGKPTSVLELVECFSKVTGQTVPCKPADRRPGDLPVVYSDVTKASKILGWRATRTLEEMCTDSWNFQGQG